MKTEKIQLRITGKTDHIDGVMEMLLGMFMVTGVLIHHHESATTGDNGISKIYVELEILTPPLGNLGEKGMYQYEGDNP